jgi:isoleucyl-tRNA synthetase
LAQKTHIPSYFKNLEACENLNIMRSIRKQITENIEILRKEKILNTTQEADITIPLELIKMPIELIEELKEIAIVANIKIGETLEIKKMLGQKCIRCRFIKTELIDDQLCKRCHNAQQNNL